MKDIYVITERTYDGGSEDFHVIGVADSRENWIGIINEYYGFSLKFEDFRDVRDSGIEADIELKEDGFTMIVTITYHTLNDVL